MTTAFLRAYDEHSDALFRQCMFKISDREKAKDILQDTFTKTWGYISKGNEVTNMKAFLYKTLNNLIIDEYRKKKESSLDDLHDEGFDPTSPTDSTAEERIDGAKAMKMIDELPEPYKTAVFLRYVNGLELREIAEITGDSENAVSVHVHRGIKKLKEIFI